MAKLLNDERETHINMVHGSSKMRIYTTEYNIMKKLDKLIEWQETEQQKPGRQWSDIKSKVVVAVLSSILTAAALAVLSLIVP